MPGPSGWYIFRPPLSISGRPQDMKIINTFRHLDWWLFLLILVIAMIGAMAVYSASYRLSADTGTLYFQRQAVWILIGAAVFFFLAAVDYRKIISGAYIFFGITTVLLIVIVILGEVRYGARRWIELGPFTIQPSEFAKVTLILLLARYLSAKITRRYRWSFILIPGLLAVLPALLILKQPDLGTAIVFLPVTAGMIFIAGARLKYLIIIILILALIAPASWLVLKDYQKSRIQVFLNPRMDPFGAGYTIIQSKIAIGSGGLRGRGWLGGTQNMLSFLPERQTDFIFSVVAEEWGFIGCLIIIGLYGLIFLRLFAIIGVCRDITGKLLVTGAVLLLASHIGINMAMVLGLLPATGLPLPLLSYGGSFTVTIFAVLGLCESVYNHRYWY